MAATVAGILLSGNHASRPAASSPPVGSLYSCSDHSLIYVTNGSAWSTWATLGGSETLAATIIDAKGDIIAGTAADTASRLAVGTNGYVLTADSTQSTGVKWATVASSGVVPWALVPHTGGVATAAAAALGAANRAVIVPATLVADATITGIRIRVGNQAGNISVGMYNSSLARVATSGSVACPAAGVADVAFTGNYSATAGRFYIGLSASSNSATFIAAGTTSIASPISTSFMETAHPLPDPFVSAGAAAVIPAMIGNINGGWAP